MTFAVDGPNYAEMNITELLLDPTWLPESLDRRRGVLIFGRYARDALVREAFLDERAARSRSGRTEVPVDQVLAAADALPRRSPPRFVFHTAFCCSTLLARALDAPGFALALKEPAIALDLVDAMRVDARYRGAYGERLARAVMALLARPQVGEEAVVVKPTNGASPLMRAALGAGAPVLLLYGELRGFLVSLLKKGEEGRAFFRAQYLSFALDGEGVAAIEARAAMKFTDLQIAALVWRHQIEAFARAVARFPEARLATLDFRRLLADPPGILSATAAHFSLSTPPEILASVAAGPIFAQDSKFADKGHDAARRDAEDAAVETRWKAELDLICGWAQNVSLGEDARLPLARAL